VRGLSSSVACSISALIPVHLRLELFSKSPVQTVPVSRLQYMQTQLWASLCAVLVRVNRRARSRHRAAGKIAAREWAEKYAVKRDKRQENSDMK